MNKITDLFLIMETITDVVTDREGLNPLTDEWFNSVITSYHNANYHKCLTMIEDACKKLISDGVFEYTILDLDDEPETINIRDLYNKCLELEA